MATPLPLFTRRIERIHELTDGPQVPVQNSSEATYCIDPSGRKWVRKRAELTGFNEIIAECIASLLAAALKLPVPCGAVADFGPEPAWLSEVVPHVAHWSEGRGHFMVNGNGLGGVLALDAVLMNADRHAGNILLQPDPDELHLSAWGIDFGDALVGWPSDYASLSAAALPGLNNLARGLPVALISAGARDAARKMSGLSAAMIREFVSDACELAREPAVESLARAVVARCGDAVALVDRYLMELGRP